MRVRNVDGGTPLGCGEDQLKYVRCEDAGDSRASLSWRFDVTSLTLPRTDGEHFRNDEGTVAVTLLPNDGYRLGTADSGEYAVHPPRPEFEFDSSSGRDRDYARFTLRRVGSSGVAATVMVRVDSPRGYLAVTAENGGKVVEGKAIGGAEVTNSAVPSVCVAGPSQSGTGTSLNCTVTFPLVPNGRPIRESQFVSLLVPRNEATVDLTGAHPQASETATATIVHDSEDEHSRTYDFAEGYEKSTIGVELNDVLPTFGFVTTSVSPGSEVTGLRILDDGYLEITLTRVGSNDQEVAPTLILEVDSPGGYYESREYGTDDDALIEVRHSVTERVYRLPPERRIGDGDEITVTLLEDTADPKTYQPCPATEGCAPERVLVLQGNSDQVTGRNIRYALSGFARSIGWDIVDMVQERTRAASRGGRGARPAADVSGLMQFAISELSADGSRPGRRGIDGDAGGHGFGIDGLGFGIDDHGFGTGHSGMGHPGAGAPTAPSPALAANGGTRGLLQEGDVGMWANAKRTSMSFTAPDGTKFEGGGAAGRAGVEKMLDGGGVLGLAVGYFDGDVDFADNGNGLTGTVGLAQWNLSPYASYSTGSLRAWGTLGIGGGEMDYSDATENFRRSGSSGTWMSMAGAGVEYDIATYSNVDLIGRIEGMSTKIQADGDDEAGALYKDQEVLVHGARGEFELGWTLGDGSEGTYRPYVTFGYRWDGGDNPQGEALEYGGGLLIGSRHLSLDGSVRSQQLEKSNDYDRNSYSLTLGYDSDGDNMGLSLDLQNRYGSASPMNTFAQNMSYLPSGGSQGSQMDLTAGYGIDLGRRGVLKPYARTELDAGSASRLGLGVRLTNGHGNVELLHTLRLTATPSAQDEHSLTLRASFNF